MRFLRVFAQQGILSNWLERKPPLPKVLQCFGLKREVTNPGPVSVYAVDVELDEVEVAAALFQTSSSTLEKRFGVLIAEADCAAAGIRIDRGEAGTTGVRSVDVRHVNLCGTQEAFGRLMASVVKSIWEGEQRLRSYPQQQIAGQLAVFTKLPDNSVHPESREKCEAILARAGCHIFHASEPKVEIRGWLEDRENFEVVAVRTFAN